MPLYDYLDNNLALSEVDPVYKVPQPFIGMEAYLATIWLDEEYGLIIQWGELFFFLTGYKFRHKSMGMQNGGLLTVIRQFNFYSLCVGSKWTLTGEENVGYVNNCKVNLFIWPILLVNKFFFL